MIVSSTLHLFPNLQKVIWKTRLTMEVERKVYHLEWPWKVIPNTPNIIANIWCIDISGICGFDMDNIIAILWLKCLVMNI